MGRNHQKTNSNSNPAPPHPTRGPSPLGPFEPHFEDSNISFSPFAWIKHVWGHACRNTVQRLRSFLLPLHLVLKSGVNRVKSSCVN